VSAPPERLSAEESLARDRAMIESLLERQGEFPRSRTMRMLLDGRGKLGLTLAAAALLAFKPQAGMRLLRWVPVARTVLRQLR
jgi:hypothetical protein